MKFSAPIAFMLLLTLQACGLGQSAANTACHNDRVSTSPGAVLFLASGLSYQVYPSDIRNSMLWLPLDKLSVCPIGGAAVRITDITAKGQQVRALRIFSLPGSAGGQPGF